MGRGDIGDQAAAHEALFLQDALDAQRRRSKLPNESAFECRCCGDEIPQARREVLPGVDTCIDCQTDLEGALRGAK